MFINFSIAGGIGPHGTCKHIVAILIVIADFKQTGKISISKSCTETLQCFHKPKKLHTGSPQKAEQLCNKLNEETDDDPRPKHMRMRPSYSGEVMMKTINFSFFSGLDIAFRYNGEKANLQAAAQDHDYLERDFRSY